MTAPLGELEAMRWLKESVAVEPELAPEMQARLWTRVSQDLATCSLVGAGAATSVANPTVVGVDTWRRFIVSRLALWSAPGLVVGAAAGAVGHAAYAPEKPRAAYVERGTATAESVPFAPSVESLPIEPTDDATTDKTAPSARVERVASPPNGETRPESPLQRERSVLDRARAALAAGEPARALAQVTRHAKQFPNGVLSEEREAIAINALVRLGSYDQASKRAANFRARYPQSLMLHSVNAAMAAVPQE